MALFGYWAFVMGLRLAFPYILFTFFYHNGFATALMGLAGLVARYMLMALFGYWAFVMGLHLAFLYILFTFSTIFFCYGLDRPGGVGSKVHVDSVVWLLGLCHGVTLGIPIHLVDLFDYNGFAMALMGLAGLVARYMLMALFGYWAFVMGLHLAFQFILLTFLHIFFLLWTWAWLGWWQGTVHVLFVGYWTFAMVYAKKRLHLDYQMYFFWHRSRPRVRFQHFRLRVAFRRFSRSRINRVRAREQHPIKGTGLRADKFCSFAPPPSLYKTRIFDRRNHSTAFWRSPTSP